MKRHPFIRNLLAIFMLGLFGFSMMPKKTVHDLFARHKDTQFAFNDSKSMQFSWAGFHCNCENLVVESPFMDNHFYPATSCLPSFQIEYATHLVFLPSQDQVDLNLRGPPQV